MIRADRQMICLTSLVIRLTPLAIGFGCQAIGLFRPTTTNRTTNTVTRTIYVLDIATGSNLNGVTLYVYKKTDTITSSFDTTSVTLSKTISLPSLVGGSSALASMAANNKFLFIGTNQSPSAVEIQKGTFTITQIGGFSPPIVRIHSFIRIASTNWSPARSSFIFFGFSKTPVRHSGPW
jgi:hypothetical protein